jgi:hypothetical protein
LNVASPVITIRMPPIRQLLVISRGAFSLNVLAEGLDLSRPVTDDALTGNPVGGKRQQVALAQ